MDCAVDLGFFSLISACIWKVRFFPWCPILPVCSFAVFLKFFSITHLFGLDPLLYLQPLAFCLVLDWAYLLDFPLSFLVKFLGFSIPSSFQLESLQCLHSLIKLHLQVLGCLHHFHHQHLCTSLGIPHAFILFKHSLLNFRELSLCLL